MGSAPVPLRAASTAPGVRATRRSGACSRTRARSTPRRALPPPPARQRPRGRLRQSSSRRPPHLGPPHRQGLRAQPSHLPEMQFGNDNCRDHRSACATYQLLRHLGLLAVEGSEPPAWDLPDPSGPDHASQPDSGPGDLTDVLDDGPDPEAEDIAYARPSSHSPRPPLPVFPGGSICSATRLLALDLPPCRGVV